MQEYMTDAEGRMVPVEKVKPEHKLEDQLVKDLLQKAKTKSQEIALFKAQSFDDINAFMALLNEKYEVQRGGKKGNLTLTSYDGLQRLQIQNADYINFGPELHAAKSLIDECLTEWSNGVNANLKMIIDRAFQVNREGKLNTGEILSLRRLNIRDDKWLRAMEAIGDSMRVTYSRLYIRFYERESVNTDWKSVSLDIARL